MNFVTGIATVIALSFASTSFAATPTSAADEVRVVALAEIGAARTARDESLDVYAGCYAARDGEAFVIAREGDHLTLETPEAWGLRSLTLRAVDATTFVAVEAAVRVEFLRDRDGPVLGASLARGDGRVVAGSRMARHGIVTIEDMEHPAKVRRGIVTIYDVPTGSSGSDTVNAVASRTF
jgi:hypothetical protein